MLDFSADAIALFSVVFCTAVIYASIAWLDYAGACVCMMVFIIVANIQVNKGMNTFWMNQPIAMGNAVFCMVNIVLAVINELYGAEKAYRAVWIGLGGSVIFSGLMFLTIASPVCCVNDATHLYKNHFLISELFGVMPSIAISSIIAYVVSELVEIKILNILSTRFWIRAMCASMISALIDNALFSILCWKILNGYTMSYWSIFCVYILPGTLMRIFFSICALPIIQVLFRRVVSY